MRVPSLNLTVRVGEGRNPLTASRGISHELGPLRPKLTSPLK